MTNTFTNSTTITLTSSALIMVVGGCLAIRGAFNHDGEPYHFLYCWLKLQILWKLSQSRVCMTILRKTHCWTWLQGRMTLHLLFSAIFPGSVYIKIPNFHLWEISLAWLHFLLLFVVGWLAGISPFLFYKFWRCKVHLAFPLGKIL